MYRDQHFFIERTFIHDILLMHTEVAVIFLMILKLIVAVVCGCIQLCLVKKILEDNFTAVQQEEEGDKQ